MTDDSPESVRWAIGYYRDGDGRQFAAIASESRVRDLTGDESALGVTGLGAADATRRILETWATTQAILDALAADAASGTWFDGSEVTALAPIAPRQVLQAGANYRTHVIDLVVAHTDIADGRSEEQVRAETAAMMDKRKAEGIPYFFIGLPTAITGPTADVILPSYSEKHDWELELAAVIGSPAFHVSPADALAHVAAYTIVNDLTTRDLVFRRDMPDIGTDWFRAKNAPGFLPVGPWLVPAEFVGDPQQLTLTLKLNGETMQNESSSDMLFTVAELVSAASQTVPLLPGDLILTGSPAGNGLHWGRLLQDGDVMESTITGLGIQRTRVVAEGVDAAPFAAEGSAASAGAVPSTEFESEPSHV